MGFDLFDVEDQFIKGPCMFRVAKVKGDIEWTLSGTFQTCVSIFMRVKSWAVVYVIP